MTDPVCIAKGAEAEVFVSSFLGRASIIKKRSPKRYRAGELDYQLRSSRTKNEARLMKEARRAGVRTPMIYDIDLAECSITMEEIKGTKVKDRLDSDPGSAAEICIAIGAAVARLHNSGICHGDLTTSNMIITDDGTICLIDLSMGKTKAELEDIGVDVRLLERAFTSAHPDLSEAFSALMDSYLSIKKDPNSVLRKVEEIKNRGRYT
ncbi:putative bifunctional tRNA threonylcarbamoyladenosine biosynthesis protein [Candidatus Methanoplasma termitum]|uniref:non-specific serine/threonine protein kinase n=1 Tax=Candidatus Methanoplasma termitum TaxID=1577791 RepID=A0A0A7LAB6_9ARCH|nr:KEOPS complex kinase/ATPase Bud32 [Candidatus Methanoplasma termitum]AIZ55963.1 putative bifunctional tRNA threonylcarbamoyladenosine biosynthesis protein [Candidatus Methanoplasma termitum]MCL2334425.1 Kae1-associated serine/threonine protein kinase [Candidatus Methanoplasma sp.]